MTVPIGSVWHADMAPGAAATPGNGEQARQSPPATRQHVIRVVGLATVAHLMRDRRFQEGVITLVIAVAAVAGLGRAGRATSYARLTAWDKKQTERHMHAAKAR